LFQLCAYSILVPDENNIMLAFVLLIMHVFYLCYAL
jgi:hypothetical protein